MPAAAGAHDTHPQPVVVHPPPAAVCETGSNPPGRARCGYPHPSPTGRARSCLGWRPPSSRHGRAMPGSSDRPGDRAGRATPRSGDCGRDRAGAGAAGFRLGRRDAVQMIFEDHRLARCQAARCYVDANVVPPVGQHRMLSRVVGHHGQPRLERSGIDGVRVVGLGRQCHQLERARIQFGMPDDPSVRSLQLGSLGESRSPIAPDPPRPPAALARGPGLPCLPQCTKRHSPGRAGARFSRLGAALSAAHRPRYAN